MTPTDTQLIDFLGQEPVSILSNKWLVQIIYKDQWHHAYFEQPPGKGVAPENLHADRGTATRHALTEAWLRYNNAQ